MANCKQKKINTTVKTLQIPSLPFHSVQLSLCLLLYNPGGELLTLKGSQFGSDPVPIAYIRNTLDNVTVKAKVKTWHDEEITISLPGLTDGTYDVTVNIPGKGTIRDR